MRVIAGTARGRRLATPPAGRATRPTTDQVREALFNVLGPQVRDARVLDLCAGTGALGIEALSRGASHAVFVEADRALCETIKKNLALTDFTDRGTVLHRDARRAGGALGGAPFDLVFLDPPYDLGLEGAALSPVVRANLLAEGALVVVEHRKGAPPPLPEEVREALEEERTRTYGDTALTLYRARAQAQTIDGSSADADADVDTDTNAEPASTIAHGPEGAPTKMARIAIYPGSFDPLTNGHHDIIKRSLVIFDKIVVAVASNVRKQPLFTIEERLELIREVTDRDPRVEVDTFEGLLVEYAKKKGAVALVRGMRAVADFEYEFQLASMNRRLVPEVETVFLMTGESHFYLSSSLVKEVASLGGRIDEFVPPAVATKLRARIAERAAGA